MTGAANSRARAVVAAEARACRRGAARAPVMHGHHLDVHVVPAPVGMVTRRALGPGRGLRMAL